ncbi:peripheral-type benzodiazepine receptor-associated protein 1 isoform X3 [Xenopus laevis]|uniref:RIMS-binding protein 2 n=1 Tax=Xenopus laevis TaxID=8355 RepID=A0A8J1M7M7_XENLA|nr:peripheral-type benzodiazepine receptor-associated protein 1 isoform X3 [Xenopus laevis]
MLKESVNYSNCSPNKSDSLLLEECHRELERLKRELENEKLKTQDVHKKCSMELRRYKEASEREKNKLANDLKSKWEQQNARELQQLKDSILRDRELEIKQLLRSKEEQLKEMHALLQKERDVAVRQARELQKQLAEELLNKGYSRKASNTKKKEVNSESVECRCKLQDVLSKLRWEYDGEQAASIRHLKMELQLERHFFLKYILENSRINISTLPQVRTKPCESGERKYGRYSLGSHSVKLQHQDLMPSKVKSPDNTSPVVLGIKYLEWASPEIDSTCSSFKGKCWDINAGDLVMPKTSANFSDINAGDLVMPKTSANCSDDFPLNKHFASENEIISVAFPYSYSKPSFENTDEQPTDVSSCTSGIEANDLRQLLDVLDHSLPHIATKKSINTLQERLIDRDCSQLKQEDLLNELRVLEQRCNALKEENITLRKNCFPETEEKVKRLKRKNAELAVIAKRLEERAKKLQEANLKMVNTPMHLKGPSLEVCKKAFARQRAKDMAEQACALLAKDKQIALLKQECLELQAKLTLGKECSSLFKLSDFDRLLRESQKEVLRLQRQIAIKYLKESLHVSKSDSQSCSSDAVSIDSYFQSDQVKESPDKTKVAPLGDGIKELELKKKRKECEILEQEVKKKQRRCEELETKLQEVQTENARLVEENSQLSSRVKWAGKVETENADLKGHLTEVTAQRDSALKDSHQQQSKLDNLEQVLKHMRDVAERRQQLEKDHDDALTALQKRQEEVKLLQEAQVEAKKEHEEATKLLEHTLDSLQAKVKTLEEKCRSQTEQFSQLSQELERFRLQTGDIGLLTSTLVTSDLPPPQCCSTPGVPQVKQDFIDNTEPVNDGKIKKDESDKERPIPQLLDSSCENRMSEVHNNAVAKEKHKLEAPQSSSKSESVHESPTYCPTPEVDTASEMEDLDADSISLNPEPESRFPAKLHVYLARYSYNPFDGPNENPEAELPLTAGEYIYIYGDMDDDGFYEGELMDGRRGLVPSNFVERVSDDDLIAFQPAEINELSQSSGQDISFLSGSSNERSEDGSSLSPLPCEMQGTSERAPDILAVPYPRKLAIIKQLARSIVVGWEPPLVTAGSGNIQSYNIYVDNELRQNVRCGGQTKALIEKLELKTRTYRISVQSVTEDGCSDRMRCTLLVGHGYSLAPTQLRVRSLSATCAEITWQPCNSNYSHALYMNDEGCGLTKAGTYWYSFSSLRPSTLYNVKVEAQPQRIPWELPLERREQKATVMQLTTPSAGPPDAPLDVQVELGPTPGVLLISWLPVTIDAAGSSNGVRVTGYAVYADGQKVLEVTSPTAGSVLVGMSHLQLLQVSKEISVRTMSPSGESGDSVPAKIPSALLNNPDCSSLLNPFSNSLINEPAMEKSLDACFDKFPSKPLTSSSPCSLPSTLDTCTKAKFSIHTSCSREKSMDSLPVRISPLLLQSPLSASSGSSQGSSGSDCLEPMVSQDGIHENAPPALVQTTSVPVSGSVQPLESAPDSVEISRINLQEKESKFLKESVELSDTKHSDIKAVTTSLQSTIEVGKMWNNNSLTESKTSAKEDCSSPEMEYLEEENKRSGNREISIEDFLAEGQEKTTTNNCTNEVLEQELSLPEPTLSHLEHSRSSTLSDIMEEEEDDNPEEEDSPKIKKMGVKGHCETSSKSECCETDSDEEILERILALPLQKHCSKKLFSIPEVTEEEDEEEGVYCKPPLAKTTVHVHETCHDLAPEHCGKERLLKNKDCALEDGALLNQDWDLKPNLFISQHQHENTKASVYGSPTCNTKRSYSLTDRANSCPESNRKKQGDAREQCSRMVANSNQNVFSPRSHNQKEQGLYNTAKHNPQVKQKNSKSNPRKCSQRPQYSDYTEVKIKRASSYGSPKALEIDIEYDTEDEEDSSVFQCSNQSRSNIWEDSSQTEKDGWSDCSSQSEPILHSKKRKALKRQVKVQDNGTEKALVHNIQGGRQGSRNDDPCSRLGSNMIVHTAGWDCTGKDGWNGNNTPSSLLDYQEAPSQDRATETSQLTGSESEYHQEGVPNKEQNPLKPQMLDTARIFVALFDYDPVFMSPNPDAYEEEVPFKEGQILQIFGDKDADGFYYGECAGKTGYIPCNMVSELHIQSEDIQAQLMKQGWVTSPNLLNDLEEIRAFSPPHPSPSLAPSGCLIIPPPKPRRSKKVEIAPVPDVTNVPEKSRKTHHDLSVPKQMVAIFDYNPRENSPNMDVEAELSFIAGDLITVFGPMDDDGFYYGEINGQRGLVPSNFLESAQPQVEASEAHVAPHERDDTELRVEAPVDPSASPSEDAVSGGQAANYKQIPERQHSYQGITSNKKKKSLFSKGRKLFKKLGSSGKSL